MLGMQPTPTQMTPQMADAGLAMAKAILAIIDNPKAIAQAEKVRADAAVLTDEQVAKYNEAVSKIEWWEEVQKQYAGWEAGATAREKKLSDKQTAFNAALKQHDDNIAALSKQISAANRKDSELCARESSANARDTNLKNLGSQLHDKELDLKSWEDSLIDREEVLGKTAKALDRPKAAGG